MRARFVAMALVAALALAIPAQAAEQPAEAPGDFQNGQSNGFGTVTMLPYLRVGGSAVPIEARFTLTDLDAVAAAHDILFAFNLKSEAATITLESVQVAGGKVLKATSTTTVDHGRQPQAHIAPADLMAEAADGQVDVVLRGRVQAEANGQSHVGAMAIAFDEVWDTLPTVDGKAQLYGFTMLMATGIGGAAMPFQGQGNTWVVLPIAAFAFLTAMLGVVAIRGLVGAPPMAALLPPPLPARAAGPPPVFGGPASPPVRRPPATQATAIRTADQARPPQPRPLGAPVVTGPMQGPLLPPHPLVRSSPAPIPGALPVHALRPSSVAPVRSAVRRPAAAAAKPARPAPPSAKQTDVGRRPATSAARAAPAGPRARRQASR
jgi:hypothetical protein